MDNTPQHDLDATLTPACPHCDGLGSKVFPCSCTGTGTKLVSGYGPASGSSAPLPDCKQCQGSGTRSLQCTTCGGGGNVRAQLVITVVNIDTGSIASETVLPGVITPEALQDTTTSDKTWVLPLQPIIDRLAGQVGGSLLATDSAGVSLGKPVLVGKGWHADLPTRQRLALEAAAIARAQALTRHRHFFTTTAPSDDRTPDGMLARLASIADRLHLDLCCYRHPTFSDEGDRLASSGWSVDFELPGNDGPAPRSQRVSYPSLAEALVTTDPSAMLRRCWLRKDLSQIVPAHFIKNTTEAAPRRDLGTTESFLSGRINTLSDDTAGAVAVRRDGSWHFARLEPGTSRDEYRETSTGQIRRLEIRTWSRQPSPPPPTWWGDPMPEQLCPQCETGETWLPCDCADTMSGLPDATCSRCGGTGTRPGTSCLWCGQIGKIRYGYTVTVADIESDAPAFHVNVDLGANPHHQHAPVPAFTEMVHTQLPEAARLTSRLFDAGIDLADLRDVTGLAPSSFLLDGGVVAPEGTPAIDLMHRHVTSASSGRPGGRVLLSWSPPTEATVAQVARLAWGLGYDLVLGAEDRNANQLAGTSLGGMRWGAALMRPGQEPDRLLTGAFGKRRLSLALQDCLDKLPHLLNIASGEKPAPLDVVDAPQQPVSPQIPAADQLEAALSTLATRCGGLTAHTVIARLAPARVEFFTLTSGSEARYRPRIPMVEAPTLTEALALIGWPGAR